MVYLEVVMSSIDVESSWLIGRARQDKMTNFGISKYVIFFSLYITCSLVHSHQFFLYIFQIEAKKIAKIFCLLATLYKFAIMNESNTDKEPKQKKK